MSVVRVETLVAEETPSAGQRDLISVGITGSPARNVFQFEERKFLAILEFDSIRCSASLTVHRIRTGRRWVEGRIAIEFSIVAIAVAAL